MSTQEPTLLNQDSFVDISQITAIGAQLPRGEYEVRLASAEGKLSNSQKPMVVAKFDVLSGEHEGEEQTIFYSLAKTVSPKNGKTYASGILDMVAACAAVGEPFPSDFRFPLDANLAAKELAIRLHPSKHPRLRMFVWEEPAKDKATGETIKDENGNPRYNSRGKIIGNAGGAPAVGAAQGATHSNLA